MFVNTLDHSFDVLAFTETWFFDDSDAVHFTGYKCVPLCRRNRKGGGVALYITNNLNYSLISQYCLITDHFEFLMIKCLNTLIAVVYRPPSSEVGIFLDFLEKVLEYCALLNKPAIICGDYNIDALSTRPSKQQLLDLLVSFGYENVIHVPTRITNTCESLIDLCFTNFDVQKVKAGVLMSGISDHLSIFIFFTPYTIPTNGSSAAETQV